MFPESLAPSARRIQSPTSAISVLDHESPNLLRVTMSGNACVPERFMIANTFFKHEPDQDEYHVTLPAQVKGGGLVEGTHPITLPS